MDYLQLCPYCKNNNGNYRLLRDTFSEDGYILVCTQCGHSVAFGSETEFRQNDEPADENPAEEILHIG